jgi:hypothetical protein
MKLAEIDLDDLQQALRTERTAWIKVADEEHRRPTDAERVTVCMLMALEHVLAGIPRNIAEMVEEDNRTVSHSSGEGDAKSTPSSEGDAKSTPSIEGDTKSTPPSEGDTKSTPSSEGDAKSTPSIEGDTKSTPSSEGDTKSTPSSEGDANSTS